MRAHGKTGLRGLLGSPQRAPRHGPAPQCCHHGAARREREREGEIDIYIYIHTYDTLIYTNIYIYIYICVYLDGLMDRKGLR